MKYFKLKKQTDFQKLFQKGNRAFSPSLTMIYRVSDKPTFGISIGKRHGKSVQRNRIKRLIREAFRKEREIIKGTYSIVFVPKVAETYDFHTFSQNIRCMIKKNNL